MRCLFAPLGTYLRYFDKPFIMIIELYKYSISHKSFVYSVTFDIKCHAILYV